MFPKSPCLKKATLVTSSIYWLVQNTPQSRGSRVGLLQPPLRPLRRFAETDFDPVAQELTVFPDVFLLTRILSNNTWKRVSVRASCIVVWALPRHFRVVYVRKNDFYVAPPPPCDSLMLFKTKKKNVRLFIFFLCWLRTSLSSRKQLGKAGKRTCYFHFIAN